MELGTSADGARGLQGAGLGPELEGHLEERAGPFGAVVPTVLCVLKTYLFFPS